jgi:hypothetical protein
LDRQCAKPDALPDCQLLRVSAAACDSINRIFIHRRNAMKFTTKMLGVACATLTALLWAVTFWTDPAPGAIITAAALTIVTVIAGVLTVLS